MLLMVISAGIGCSRPGAAERLSQDRAAAEESLRAARELDASLESVEARLYSGRATVRLWTELAVRHKTVSALACINAEAHAEGMDISARKDRAMRAKHRFAAASQEVVTDARVSGFQTTRATPIPATHKKPAR